jgi:hypothetical protein
MVMNIDSGGFKSPSPIASDEDFGTSETITLENNKTKQRFNVNILNSESASSQTCSIP